MFQALEHPSASLAGKNGAFAATTKEQKVRATKKINKMDGAGYRKTCKDKPVEFLGNMPLVMYHEPSLSACLQSCGLTIHVDGQRMFLFSTNQRTGSK